MTEFQEIRGQVLTLGKGAEHRRAMLEGVRDSLRSLGHRALELIYIDDLSMKAQLQSIFTELLKDVIPIELPSNSDLPTAKLPSDVAVCVLESTEAVQEWCGALVAEVDGSGESVHVGFDTECPSHNDWPSITPSRKTATVQIARQGRVAILWVSCSLSESADFTDRSETGLANGGAPGQSHSPS